MGYDHPERAVTIIPAKRYHMPPPFAPTPRVLRSFTVLPFMPWLAPASIMYGNEFVVQSLAHMTPKERARELTLLLSRGWFGLTPAALTMQPLQVRGA